VADSWAYRVWIVSHLVEDTTSATLYQARQTRPLCNCAVGRCGEAACGEGRFRDKPFFDEVGAAIDDVAARYQRQAHAFRGFNSSHQTGTAVAKRSCGKIITAMTEPPMPSQNDQSSSFPRLNLMDTVLYLVAGSAMTFISITFLLWLRY
jgi:hypothetical protein